MNEKNMVKREKSDKNSRKLKYVEICNMIFFDKNRVINYSMYCAIKNDCTIHIFLWEILLMKKKFNIIISLVLLIFSSVLLINTTSYFIVMSILIVEIILVIINVLFNYKLTKSQALEIKNLNLICDSTRTFRHDFNNIMQAIGGYIQTNNMYDLKSYYNKLVPECFKINGLYRFHSKLMMNAGIYSIIADKYNLAEKKNVKMSLNILLDLNSLNIDTYTLTRILGILLDNAIEAASECSKKVVNVSFQDENY